jgi:hypothetical protein
MRLMYCLLLVFLAIPGLTTTLYAQDIWGVWRTIDASDEEGKRQGGVVFRDDNTGEFFSPILTTSGKNAEEIIKLLETATAASSNLKFKYTYENSTVSIIITHVGNLTVSSSKAVAWKAAISGRNLKLSAQDGSGKWISLTKI